MRSVAVGPSRTISAVTSTPTTGIPSAPSEAVAADRRRTIANHKAQAIPLPTILENAVANKLRASARSRSSLPSNNTRAAAITTNAITSCQKASARGSMPRRTHFT
jgi:hypothetical protein